MLGIVAYSALNFAALLNPAAQVAEPPEPVPQSEGDIFPPPTTGQTLIVGEFHGSAEIPAMFLDLVRRTARERPVVVGLELPPSTERLQCRLGGRLPMSWLRPSQDGRTSVAMRDLVCALRMRFRSERVRIVYLSDEGPRGDDFDLVAAARYHEALSRRPAAGLILTGSYHARNAEGTIAHHLRARGVDLITAVVSAPVSQAWHCRNDGSCGSAEVRINFCSQGASAADRPRWYAVRATPATWDYCLSVPRLTASPPASGARGTAD
ncbi:MAG TPA: hypothetical protein VGB79_08360 [Allosphingosinicella sp.]|jgi:hypothetical protein